LITAAKVSVKMSPFRPPGSINTAPFTLSGRREM
jgi:hypothetical protein